MIYPNGSVKIIDRSKNIFKLSQGEYIAPEKLENIFVLSPYIAQSMVYGDSLKSCVVAVVIPDDVRMEEWKTAHKKESIAAVIEDPDFKKEIMEDLARLAKENKLSGLEKPKDIHLSTDAFSIEND
jgi:long-chain acyl-CoA synthetase